MKTVLASNSMNFRDANRWFVAAAILGMLCLPLSAFAQVNVLTQHNDNNRSGLNANETYLTPANVNSTQFGTLFSQPVDGLVAAQPLYVSGVNIPGKGVHNVVYAVTLHDSVYAFDADNSFGSNAAPLWSVNFLNPGAGITTEPGTDLGCLSTTLFSEMGILGTPTIDANSGTMYLVAKTKENGTYHFHLHALDITTGMEKFAGPIDLTATVTGNAGTLTLLTAGKNMMSRPGILLSQGIVYLAFGSNGCDGGGTRGWILAYDAATMLQLGVFNDESDSKAAQGNIWMAGSGLASDDNGSIFFSTANGPFDANLGTHDYGSSLVKVGWNGGSLSAVDYFTPYNQAFVGAHDLDIGSAGVTLLPDQPNGPAHLMVGSGKEGSIYLVNRDNMGGYNPVDNSQITQFLPFEVGSMFSTAAYWNNNLYFTGQNQGPTALSLSGGQLTLLGRSSTAMQSPHTPSISANGGSNGILWVPGTNNLLAFDATNITRPAIFTGGKATFAHFNTPTVTNGKVYMGANLSLQVMGLFGTLQATSGSGQATQPLAAFPIPLQTTAVSPYTGLPIPGISVTYGDGGKGGSFNPAVATTDSNGVATTQYTAPKKVGAYAITAKCPADTTANFTLTVVPGTPAKVVLLSGSKQTAPVQTTYAAPLVVSIQDVNSNGVAGQTVTFSDGGKGGTFNPTSAVTDANGKAQSFYTTPTKPGSLTFTMTSGSFHQTAYGTVTAGPAAAISTVSGNNQTGGVSTTLPTSLVVLAVDQFNNRVPGASVSFSDGGAGGGFSASNVVTDVTGQAATAYTLPAIAQTVTIVASVGSVSTNLTETAQ